MMQGAVGGPGGRGGRDGGSGGNGGGSRLYISRAQTVQVNVRGRRQYGLNDSGDSDQDSPDDFNFRRIRWGDVYLQRQLYVDGPASDRPWFYNDRCRSSVRIVRSAKIDGREFTVATYEGNSAAKEWKEDVEKYMEIRHESILQLYGTVRCPNICAAVFHGDFIPYKDFVQNYHHSAILTCYIQFYVAQELGTVQKYIHTRHGYSGYKWPASNPDLALLISSSNGRLSVDLAAGPWDYILGSVLDDEVMVMGPLVLHPNPMKILASKDLSYIAKTITLTDYHACNDLWWCKIARYTVIPPAATVHLGAIYCLSDNNSLEVVAAVPHRPSDGMEKCRFGFDLVYSFVDVLGGWKRFSYNHMTGYLDVKDWSYTLNTDQLFTAWLSQANHIFGRLKVKSGFHKHVMLDQISLRVKLKWSRKRSRPSQDGFLFLCPEQDFITGSAFLKWQPPERSTKLGFPTILLVTELAGKSWDESVYVGLREFHKCKGFDPESQDMAVELEEPLYELLLDQEPLVVEEYKPSNLDFTKLSQESDTSTENSTTREEGDDRTNWLDSDECEVQISKDINLDTNREFTSFNENGEFTGQTSTSASFLPLVDPSMWPSFPMHVAFEEMLTPGTSQSVSAWVESLQTTAWDNNQNWFSNSFDTPTPHVPTLHSEPSIHTSPFDFIDDPQYNVPSTSQKRRTEDNDSEYESASSAKRARLEY
ncbi:hypothetical protein R3P38DRAFT_416736 [Favolaschia claudopus]|uniref:Uncharacterized protein n=1 Tax=Favolaschia claudopus TaxID=2862362 RepID=A0AAV9ZH61_9AGAR